MATTIRDVMTDDLVTCPPDATIAEAARLMRDHDIGDVLVTDEGRLRGIVTDRDLVVRCLAEDASADAAVGRAYSGEPFTLTPGSSIDDAVRVMRERALRRVPVVDGDRAVGIVSIGDLAIEREPTSALGEISAAPPNT